MLTNQRANQLNSIEDMAYTEGSRTKEAIPVMMKRTITSTLDEQMITLSRLEDTVQQLGSVLHPLMDSEAYYPEYDDSLKAISTGTPIIDLLDSVETRINLVNVRISQIIKNLSI